jgi:hypothetical protein
MADSEDLTNEALARKLSTTYTTLAAACDMLPIPITLPRRGVTNIEALPAVRRIVDLAEEQPMPEDVQAHLFTAAIFWLSALDVFAVLVNNEWNHQRAFQVAGCLSVAHDALSDLAEWLLAQD